jgi:hypothetical protein
MGKVRGVACCRHTRQRVHAQHYPLVMVPSVRPLGLALAEMVKGMGERVATIRPEACHYVVGGFRHFRLSNKLHSVKSRRADARGKRGVSLPLLKHIPFGALSKPTILEPFSRGTKFLNSAQTQSAR